MTQTQQKLKNVTGYKKSPTEFEIQASVMRMFSNKNYPPERAIQEMNTFIQENTNDTVTLTVQPLQETDSIPTELPCNITLSVEFKNEAEEDELLEILAQFQTQLTFSAKFRIQFPSPDKETQPVPLLSIQTSPIVVEPDVDQETFFLLQSYLSKPKLVSNSAERFMDVYKIFESKYTLCWTHYAIILNSGENICSKIYKGKVSELLKLYLVLNICLNNFEQLKTQIETAQVQNIFLKYESTSEFSVGMIDTSNVKKLLSTLSLRWYTIRCALVHSDPIGWHRGREEYKAAPVIIPNQDDLKFLDNEVPLIEYFALMLIALGLKKLLLRVQEIFNSGFRVPVNKESLLKS